MRLSCRAEVLPDALQIPCASFAVPGCGERSASGCAGLWARFRCVMPVRIVRVEMARIAGCSLIPQRMRFVLKGVTLETASSNREEKGKLRCGCILWSRRLLPSLRCFTYLG